MLAALALAVASPMPPPGVSLIARATVTIIRPAIGSKAAPESDVEVQRRDAVRPTASGGEQPLHLIEYE